MWGVTDVKSMKFEGICYGFIRSKKSFSSARSFCESANSSLVRFERQAEFNAVSNWIYNTIGGISSTEGVWTSGYRRSLTSNVWLWSTIHGGTFGGTL